MPLTSSELKNAAFEIFLALLVFLSDMLFGVLWFACVFDFASFSERTSIERKILQEFDFDAVAQQPHKPLLQRPLASQRARQRFK